MFKGTLCFIKHLTYPERLAVLNLESLELRILKADLVMYYEILNNWISINFDDHFTMFTLRKSSSISPRSTGPSVLKPFCRTNRIANNFLFRYINIWHTLPATITNGIMELWYLFLLHVGMMHMAYYSKCTDICCGVCMCVTLCEALLCTVYVTYVRYRL